MIGCVGTNFEDFGRRWEGNGGVGVADRSPERRRVAKETKKIWPRLRVI